MHKSIYSLYDKKALVYMNPLVFGNDGEAMRWFTSVVNREEDTNVALHPQDFILCRLGVLDDESGKFTNEYVELAQGNSVKVSEPVYTIKQLINMIQEGR